MIFSSCFNDLLLILLLLVVGRFLTLHEFLSSLFLLFNLKQAEVVSEPKQLFIRNFDGHYFKTITTTRRVRSPSCNKSNR